MASWSRQGRGSQVLLKVVQRRCSGMRSTWGLMQQQASATLAGVALSRRAVSRTDGAPSTVLRVEGGAERKKRQLLGHLGFPTCVEHVLPERSARLMRSGRRPPLSESERDGRNQGPHC